MRISDWSSDVCSSDLGVSDMTQRLGSTKGTVFRHLQTLLERGYLSQNPRKLRYRLGTRAHLLGEAARGSMALLAIGAAAPGRLQSATRQTAVLSRVNSRTVTVLNPITGPRAQEPALRRGGDQSMPPTPAGKQNG